MIDEVLISIGACFAALVLTLLLARRSGTSLGLPLAYMINLLLIHVPGAYAYAISGGQYAGFFPSSEYVALGIRLTAIGSVCFAVGLYFSMTRNKAVALSADDLASTYDKQFLVFCLLGGWLFAFVLTPLQSIPTLGAAIYYGSSIWMLAVLIGLSAAIKLRQPLKLLGWIVALMVYPSVLLVFSGFLSYGSAAVIIVSSFAIIRLKSALIASFLILVGGYLGIGMFVNYFIVRAELRATLWSGAGLDRRIDAITNAFSHFELFNSENYKHLDALSQRLNQNEFVGISAYRLEQGYVEYLMGRSFFEALVAPIPRAIWPDKPVFGGSGSVVRDMTGLDLSATTSWGVGNVMEFYINFGMWSLVGGFIVLGFLIGWLDRKSSESIKSRQLSQSLIYFLPCVALIQPNGSLVELAGGAFAALLAALGWRFAWDRFFGTKRRMPLPASPHRIYRRG